MGGWLVKTTAFSAIALIAMAAPAAAQMRITGNFGDWFSSEGFGSLGSSMCSAGIAGADRSFFIKDNGHDFMVHVFKDGWDVPGDQPVEIVLQIDAAAPVHLWGFGTDGTHGGVEVVLHPEAIWEHSGRPTIVELPKLLQNGRTFRLSFPDGDEPPWEGSLSGSGKALTEMMACRQRLAARLTQPFGAKKAAAVAPALGPAPAQPFGALPPALPQNVERELSQGPAKSNASPPK
jgi:hypothetical protein